MTREIVLTILRQLIAQSGTTYLSILVCVSGSLRRTMRKAKNDMRHAAMHGRKNGYSLKKPSWGNTSGYLSEGLARRPGKQRV